MIDLHKELNFSSYNQEDTEIKHFILEACRKVEQEQTDHLRKIKKPELDDELMNQFIVSGIPVIKEEQADKFLSVFKKSLLAKRDIGEKNGLVDINSGVQAGVGNQTLFMTYKTPAEAKVAFGKLNNLKFDKDHRMSCVWVNELRGIIEEEERQPMGADFKEPNFTHSKDRKEHNLDEQLRSYFLFREDKMVYLELLDHLDKSAVSALSSEFMPLDFQVNKMVFSPKGSYLAVCSTKGIHIYVGAQLKYKGFLPQVNPVDAKFSSDERFLISSNGGLAKARQNLIVWAVEEEIKIKGYKAHKGQTIESFQFSEDCQNLAIALVHDVTFFKCSTVEELLKQVRIPEEEQHIIKAVFVQKVAWLKSKNDILVMCYEPDYNPVTASATRLFLYNVETKFERKWRAWSEHARQGEIFVSEKGEWVAIALRKFIKKGHFATVVQIANLLKKEEAIEISSVEFKEDVGNISIDSYNNRMAVIHKDEAFKSINVRYIVSFFELTMKNRELDIIKVGEINNNLQNRVVLASNGGFFALYNVNTDSAERGRISFGMIVKEQKEKGKKVLAFEFTKKDLMVNGMIFFKVDQSGRFILLGTEKGYQIWNFIGEIIFKDTLQKNIHDVQWRPRMINRLTSQGERTLVEQEKEIRKKYEVIDDKRINHLKWAKAEAREKRKKEFFGFIVKKNQWFKAYEEKRENILGFRDFDVRRDKYDVNENFIDLQ